MPETLRKQTRKLARAAQALCEAYDPETLHGLRVAIRRIRSLLKGRGKRRTRRFRRTWGGFAHVTNRARDWDVFVERVQERFDAPTAERFRAASREPVEASHRAVLEMLRSKHWKAHLEEWTAHLERRSARAPTMPSPHSGARNSSQLSSTLTRVDTAMALALQGDDDDAWHRLRIAVKEARYRAERERGGDMEPDPREVIKTCKRLQAALGAWHDCVVQLNLLDELERMSPEAARLAPELRPAILQLRAQHLAEAREQLAAQSVFGHPSAPRAQKRG
jgi:CHAD domain-containing protein